MGQVGHLYLRLNCELISAHRGKDAKCTDGIVGIAERTPRHPANDRCNAIPGYARLILIAVCECRVELSSQMRNCSIALHQFLQIAIKTVSF